MNRNVPIWILVIAVALIAYVLVSVANDAQSDRATDATITQIERSYQ